LSLIHQYEGLWGDIKIVIGLTHSQQIEKINFWGYATLKRLIDNPEKKK